MDNPDYRNYQNSWYKSENSVFKMFALVYIGIDLLIRLMDITHNGMDGRVYCAVVSHISNRLIKDNRIYLG